MGANGAECGVKGAEEFNVSYEQDPDTMQKLWCGFKAFEEL